MKRLRTVLLPVLLLAWTAPGAAAPLTPEMQKQAEAATFEVVLKKPDKEAITYEKPLPMELLPYAERTDAYWSIGTAFAIGPATFVSAGHVLTSPVSGQFGNPAIRAADGKVYPIDKILKFALREDFVVFSVQGAPAVSPFETNTKPGVDEPIFAVGNALGEGVVIRDGLLTSRTPEAQDGSWKWLRFSAAASPGNSGGPLLDAQVRVLGIVTAKSPNENLNYASPIELVLNGSGKSALLDQRESFGLPPILQGTIVGDLQDSFPLPASYEAFARQYRAAVLKYYRANAARLLASQAEEIFPRGASAKLLATLYRSPEPSLVEQQEDKSWDAHSCAKAVDTPLSGDGRAWFCPTGLFRLVYPAGSVDAHRYADSKEFMDLLLKGIKIPRLFGSQAVRVTSLGPAQEDAVVRDRFGRVWQRRGWSLGFADYYLQTLALPTPDGYVGLLSVTPGAAHDLVTEAQSFSADYLYMTYEGSLPQWRAFLDRRELRPALFDHIRLRYEDGKELHFDSPRLQLDSGGVVTVGPQSTLELRMTYMLDHDGLAWDIGGVVVNQDRDGHTYVAMYRQPKPAQDSGREARERWEHMNRRDADYNGVPGHDDHYQHFWIRTVAADREQRGGDPASRPLYEVVYSTNTSVLPRQMEDIREKLLQDLRVSE
jgi:serine protease Do